MLWIGLASMFAALMGEYEWCVIGIALMIGMLAVCETVGAMEEAYDNWYYRKMCGRRKHRRKFRFRMKKAR